jgi:glutamate-5-semialdehyde dehydrogenase
MDTKSYINSIGQRALSASRQLACTSAADRRQGLLLMAEYLAKGSPDIIAANIQDLDYGRKRGLSAALLDRLELNESRISGIIKGVRTVAELDDPIGHILEETTRSNGLIIRKVSVPIGVIAVVYESRPNVTADSAALCFKSSNSVILRGGSEAINSNKAIAICLRQALSDSGLPQDAIQLVETTDRDAVKYIVQLDGIVDLVMPRGGEGLIAAIVDSSRVPVIKHYKGVCHIYVDKSANLQSALQICKNAKCQRPGVCNAVETILVNEQVAETFLPLLQAHLPNVELRGDGASRRILPTIKAAIEDDWYAEYLDLILALRIVSGVSEAIEHINLYGSHHSDAIITNDAVSQSRFLNEVDSAAVYVNASTRFTDGGEFGMGAEIGISTDKLHARGPMGVRELTTYKYQIVGTGQVRG